MFNNILTSIEPFLVEVIVALIGSGILWLARKLPAAMGALIEAKWRESEALMRDSLHMAIRSGLNAAVAEGRVGQQIFDKMLDHVYSSVPDAISHLGATKKVVLGIANRYIAELGIKI